MIKANDIEMVKLGGMTPEERERYEKNKIEINKKVSSLIAPLIDVKTEKGRRDTTTAQIALVSLTSKITNLITTLDFIQTEPVSDVVKETTYRLYGDGRLCGPDSARSSGL